jgi:cation diffusion facilitator family transporter
MRMESGMENSDRVKRLALWGIPLSLFVMGLKLVAWWVTGSVALLSDGLESSVNVVAAIVAFAAITYAAKPADKTHPFGHHKAEYLSAVLEGVLIVVAALLIVAEALPAVLAPTQMEAPALGLAINFLAGVINVIWAYTLIRAGKRYRSPALSADGQHILSDVVTSIGVLVGLVLAIATGYAVLDPLLAVLVALNILYQGWKVIAHSVDGLMDHAVEPEEAEAIQVAIAAHGAGSLGVHDLKTRQGRDRRPSLISTSSCRRRMPVGRGARHLRPAGGRHPRRAAGRADRHPCRAGDGKGAWDQGEDRGGMTMSKTDVSGLSQLGQAVELPVDPGHRGAGKGAEQPRRHGFRGALHGAGIHLALPDDRPAGFRASSSSTTCRARLAGRIEVAEALPAVLPQPRRLPRGRARSTSAKRVVGPAGAEMAPHRRLLVIRAAAFRSMCSGRPVRGAEGRVDRRTRACSPIAVRG